MTFSAHLYHAGWWGIWPTVCRSWAVVHRLHWVGSVPSLPRLSRFHVLQPSDAVAHIKRFPPHILRRAENVQESFWVLNYVDIWETPKQEKQRISGVARAKSAPVRCHGCVLGCETPSTTHVCLAQPCVDCCLAQQNMTTSQPQVPA